MPNPMHGIIGIHDKKTVDIGNAVGVQYIASDPQRAQHILTESIYQISFILDLSI